MPEGLVKKVGGSYAIFLPAEEARSLRLTEGEKVQVTVARPLSPKLFGMCKDLNLDWRTVQRLLREADRGE
ncbi:MAG: AbrB/MazE/SpoVT family DNA-binding domain-containing protein [Euryarchaeota archaeon]|nr:AbrB/MazE/SpoVT family DNA-binding domain-containing protein [Euryarchaeota archaeon]